MPLTFGNDAFRDRFDWYAWSAPVYEGAEAVLKELAVRKFRNKRLKGVRVVGAARNMTGEELRSYEEKLRCTAGLSAPSSADVFFRSLRIPHSVTLCEPFILDFDDGTALEYLPGEGLSARIGWNRIPPTCTEGLNRPNFRPERLFTPYLAGQSLQRVLLEEKSSMTRRYEYSGGGLESSLTEGNLVRCVFRFSRHATLTVTSEGTGWYELALCRENGADSLPYLRFREASLGVEQPLFCHGGSGEEPCFLVCAEGPDGRSPVPAFSMDEDVLEMYLLPFLERRFESARNAREAWEPKGFDVYGCNDYSTSAVRAMLSDMRVAVFALREGKDTPLRSCLLEAERRRGSLHGGGHESDACSKEDVLAGAVNVYERFLTRMEGMLNALPDDCRIRIMGL